MSPAATARPQAAAHGGEIDILRSFARRIDPSDAGAFNNLGVLYFRKGLTEEAIASFAKALALDERMGVARRNLEIAYGESGILEQRLHELEERLRANPQDLEALVQSGIGEKTAGRLERAHTLFQRAIELDPDSSVVHFLFAETLYNRGLHEDAMRSVRRSIELYLLQRDTGAAIATADRFAREFSPTAKTWNGRGVALQLEGRHAEAEDSYNRALEVDSSYAFAENNLGVLRWHKGDTKGAINSFRRALQAATPPVEARLNLALGLFKRKHTELALEAYRQVLSAAPEHPVAWNGVGLILVELNKYADARNAFARAIQANPDFAEAHYNLSFSLARDFITKGLYDRAQAEIARVLARGGDKILGLVLAGDAFAAQGLHGEALERYRRALDMEDANTYARQGIARSLLALGRAEEARPFAEALVEAGSTDVNLLLLAAEARVASLDNPKAREILVALEKNESRNANVMKRVGDLYAALGDANAAISAYRASLAVDERQVETRVSLGRLLARAGDDSGSIRELETVLVTAPNHDAAVVELVGPYRRTGRSRSALPRVVALIRRDVYHFPALIALGEILIDLAREGDAMNAFERVLRFDPNHSEALRYHRLLQRGRR